jgi:addiction module RelE/StbE family toxin
MLATQQQKKTLEFILSLGVFREKREKTSLERAFEDIEKGRVTFVNGPKQHLAKGEVLPKRHYPHPLKGYPQKGNDVVMECHIQPDWLFVWKQNDTELTLLLTDTGTHADLFGM